MLKLLLAGSAVMTVLVLSSPAKSAIIATLPDNPTSQSGNFTSAPGAGPFKDQVVFRLSGGPQFLTIANATNIFADPGQDQILNWTAAIWRCRPEWRGQRCRRCAAVRSTGRQPVRRSVELSGSRRLRHYRSARHLLCRVHRHRIGDVRLWRKYQHVRYTISNCRCRFAGAGSSIWRLVGLAALTACSGTMPITPV